MEGHSEQDYADQLAENRKMKDKIAQYEKEKQTIGRSSADIGDKIASMESEIETHKKNEEARQAQDKEREEKEKHEIASKIAQAMAESDDIPHDKVSEQANKLNEEYDKKTLQAMLPFAESSAKKSMSHRAKTPGARQASVAKWEMSEGENKQAAEDVKAFAQSYRGGLYV